MALTLTKIGSEVSTEKLTYQLVTNDATVTSVLMKVYIAPSADVRHTLEHVPDFGTTDTFTFEVNSIFKDYFTFAFNPLTGSVISITENVIATLAFYEVKSTVVSGTVNESANVVIKNITQDTFEIETFDFDDYDCGDTGDSSSKLLTSAPTTLDVSDGESAFLSALNVSFGGAGNSKQEWVVESYNAAGTLLGTATNDCDFPARTTGVPSISTSLQKDISNIRLDFDVSGGVVEQRVYIQDQASPNTVRSETRTFKIYEPCRNSITLTWMNEFGVQDTFTFLGNITYTGNYNDSTYTKSRPVNPSSIDVGELVYKSDYGREYEIYTERTTQDIVKWLSKMLRNKKAAIVYNGQYYPIVITDKDAVLNDEFNPVTLFSLKFRLANRRKGLV